MKLSIRRRRRQASRSSVRLLLAACGRTTARAAVILAAMVVSQEPVRAYETEADATTPLAPRLEGVGQSARDFPACSADAQPFLNQGLNLVYAFNHNEALRAFREAERLDPTCPFAPWGEALALGPNINDPMPPERHAEAYSAMERAQRLLAAASADAREVGRSVEAQLLDALATRYSADSNAERSALDRAYAEAMTSLADLAPTDADVLTLAGAAWMNTMPWNYWDDTGTRPQPHTEQVLQLLETAIREAPRHTGAHHYYIHITEASRAPDRALPSADVLGDLAPSAGHLVHMPSHTYIRTGRYLQAAEANERAILADEDYVAQCQAQGIYPLAYYPHNIHFLWSAATFSGQSRKAIDAALKVAAKIPADAPSNVGFLQNFRATPHFAWVRFGRWNDILNAELPSAELVFTRGVAHYARALAHAAQGNLRQARAERRQVKRLARSDAARELVVSFSTAEELLTLAEHIISGEIARAKGRERRAERHFLRAIAIEDGLRYSEPPIWHHPTRHRLGDLYLKTGDLEAAAAVFRSDLDEFRDNGWALFGLAQALERLRPEAPETEDAKRRLAEAWREADVELRSASFH